MASLSKTEIEGGWVRCPILPPPGLSFPWFLEIPAWVRCAYVERCHHQACFLSGWTDGVSSGPQKPASLVSPPWAPFPGHSTCFPCYLAGLEGRVRARFIPCSGSFPGGTAWLVLLRSAAAEPKGWNALEADPWWLACDAPVTGILGKT